MFSKLLEQFKNTDVAEENPQTAYRRLRRAIDGGGYPAGSVIKLTSFSTPLPPTLVWLEPPHAVPCARPTDGVIDGVIDVAQVFADEAQLAEIMSQKPLPDYTRAEMREMFHLSDLDLNFAEDLGWLPRHRGQYMRAPEVNGGRVTDVIELWSRRDVALAKENILRLFPHALDAR